MAHHPRQLLIIFSLASALLVISQGQKKCYGLALAGGGDRGSYEAGVVNGLVDNLPIEDVPWEYISGISAGAVNSVPFSVFPVGQERQIADLMHTMWYNLTSSDLYDSWEFGLIEGLFFKNGLLNTAPERQLLEGLFDKYGSHQQRKVFVGASDISHGKFQQFYNMELNKEDFISAVMSSSAAPMVFETQTWNNATYSDGGGFLRLNWTPLIEECRQQGYADEDIVIDAVFSYLRETPALDPSKDLNPTKLLLRYLDMIFIEWYNHYIPQAYRAYPNVSWRYLVTPSEKLPDGKIPLFFKHDEMVQMFQIGYQDAKNTVTMGEGAKFQEVFAHAKAELAKEMENLLA